MAEVERVDEAIANGVRAGAVVSTMSQAVQERESPLLLLLSVVPIICSCTTLCDLDTVHDARRLLSHTYWYVVRSMFELLLHCSPNLVLFFHHGTTTSLQLFPIASTRVPPAWRSRWTCPPIASPYRTMAAASLRISCNPW